MVRVKRRPMECIEGLRTYDEGQINVQGENRNSAAVGIIAGAYPGDGGGPAVCKVESLRCRMKEC